MNLVRATSTIGGLTLVSRVLGFVRDMEGSTDAPLARYTHDSGSGLQIYALRVDLPDTTGGV